MNNYILEYYQKIKDGSIVVGSWVLKWYEYIVKGLENKAFFYSPKAAKRAGEQTAGQTAPCGKSRSAGSALRRSVVSSLTAAYALQYK